jgi:hypothetical protein
MEEEEAQESVLQMQQSLAQLTLVVAAVEENNLVDLQLQAAQELLFCATIQH